MADLPVILKSKKIIINDFFERSSIERIRYERAQEGFCNMEIPLNKFDLPIFSNSQNESCVLNQSRSNASGTED